MPTKMLLFDTIKSRVLAEDACFLCGTQLNATNRSDEHIIPRWAQERFDLWNQKLVLLNRTTIPYRSLTIPCCWNCNNNSLQPLESLMSNATLEGPQAVQSLDKLVIFSWLGKIFYGILYRELFLLFNRIVPDDGTIASSDLLDEYRLHHLFIQNVRIPMEFITDFPASIFVYETKEPPGRRYQWDFRDALRSLFISVRIGRVGITGVLQDGGAQERHLNLERFLKHPLHPIQHIEFGAKVCYKSFLFNRTPKYAIIDTDLSSPIKVVQLPLAGFSTEPIFDRGDDHAYAQLLSQFTELPIESIYNPEQGVFTWFQKPDGRYNDIDFSEIPWPPWEDN